MCVFVVAGWTIMCDTNGIGWWGWYGFFFFLLVIRDDDYVGAESKKNGKRRKLIGIFIGSNNF